MRTSRTSTPILLGLALALATSSAGEAVKRRAFVTSVTGTGDLSTWDDAEGQTGLAAGDAICRNRAAAAGLTEPTAFRAWLSNASADAYCHLRGQSGHRVPGCTGSAPAPAGPWFTSTVLSPLPVAESLDGLMSPTGAIYRPVLYDEFGAVVDPTTNPPTEYWTGTDEHGENDSSYDCSDWTADVFGVPTSGATGDALSTADVWTAVLSQSCSSELRLLCLGTGESQATGQKWSAPGAVSFLTRAHGSGDLGSWPGAGSAVGVAAGDAICRASATVAHLPAPGSFVAWLSTATTDARDRLTSNGPFLRIDGVIVADNKADLTNGTNDNSMHQFENGAYVVDEGGGYAWTGTLGDGTADGTDHCSGWTNGTTAVSGLFGAASSTRDFHWTDEGSPHCNADLHLYCFSNVITLFWDGFDLTHGTGRWSSVGP